MTKSAFVLKQVLVLLICLTSIVFSLNAYYQKSIYLQKQAYLLEKQKAIELVLYSYFVSHPKKSESNVIKTSQVQVTYSITQNETTSRLDSEICFEECYLWNLVYTFENKQMEIIEN